MKYKYIGTEEQLVEHGFEMEHEDFGTNSRPLIHGVRKTDTDEVYVLLQYSFDYLDDDIRLLCWNIWGDNPLDIMPYIQDLIDDGLVEVVE